MTIEEALQMLGRRLAEERRRVGWSQKQLAERLGVGRSAVAMIETERAPIYADRLADLERDGFDPVYVLTGQRGQVLASRLLNWELLSSLLATVRSWTQDRHIELPTEKEILLAKILYDHFAEKGVIDEARVEEALQLVA
ncbi:MAG: helix-turn-helix transcriptional regulator [Nitrospira sp.]|nr:helix-turn-helix transcriptional regulator [Nitrospira sp.]